MLKTFAAAIAAVAVAACSKKDIDVAEHALTAPDRAAVAAAARAVLGDKQNRSSVAGIVATLDELDNALDEARVKTAFKPDRELDDHQLAIFGKLLVQYRAVLDAKVLDSDALAEILAFYADVAA